MVDSGVRIGSLTFIPFLLLQKGATVESLGFALALVFAGGAAGKLVCGFVAERVGILRTVILTEVATGVLLVAVIVLLRLTVFRSAPLPVTVHVFDRGRVENTVVNY